jgi:hypothetical protein
LESFELDWSRLNLGAPHADGKIFIQFGAPLGSNLRDARTKFNLNRSDTIGPLASCEPGSILLDNKP